MAFAHINFYNFIDDLAAYTSALPSFPQLDLAMGGGIRKVSSLLSGALLLVWPVASAPPGFPASGNGLWYNKPAGVWSRGWLPVGNGYLAGRGRSVLI